MKKIENKKKILNVFKNEKKKLRRKDLFSTLKVSVMILNSLKSYCPNYFVLSVEQQDSQPLKLGEELKTYWLIKTFFFFSTQDQDHKYSPPLPQKKMDREIYHQESVPFGNWNFFENSGKLF